MSEENNNQDNTPETAIEASWRDNLPDTYKTAYPEFKKPEDFVKGYDELYRKMGSSISKPKDDAPRADWDKFYAKLGRPESPDKYEFPIEDNTGLDNDFLGKFKSKAYEAGVSQRQAKDMFDWYQSEIKGTEERYLRESEAQKEKALTDLKDRWGSTYDRKLEEVQGFARQIMSDNPGFEEKFVKYGNDPDFIDIIDKVKNKYVKEDYINNSRQSFVDKSDVQSEARKLMADEDYKFNIDKQNKVKLMYQDLERSGLLRK